WLRQLSSKDKENKDAAEKSLAELEKGSEQFSISDRLTLLSGLAQVHERAGHIRDAKRLWTEVSKDDHDVGLSQRLNSRLRLFDLALLEHDNEAMQKILAEIKQLEGQDDAVMWRYGEAVRRLVVSERGDQDALKTASNLLSEARVRRKSWPRLVLLQA